MSDVVILLVGVVKQDMEPPQLGRAATIYEKLGRSCMEKKLLQMNAKGYWLQAGLCLLGEICSFVTLRHVTSTPFWIPFRYILDAF